MDIEELLSEDELLNVLHANLSNVGGRSVEEVGAQLAIQVAVQSMPPGVMGFLSSELWNRFKREMKRLICTDDKRYAATRKKLTTLGTKSQTAVVSTISVAVSPHLGISSGIAVTFCTLVLVAVAQVGKNALCDDRDLDVKIKNGAKKATKKPSR
jgi:hypothetical protein